MTIHLPAQADARAVELLQSAGLGRKPLAVLVPGTIWETKHWHPTGFAEVGRHLIASGYEVVVVGTLKDRIRSQLIAADCPGACDLTGKTTVAGLVALVRRARLCVTNDSGSMHVAVAVGSPVVSVFGPTNPVWIGPYGRPHAVVQAELPCTSCYLRRLRDCPNDHKCMHEVTPAMVIDRIRGVVAGQAKTGATRTAWEVCGTR
jgi:ADP-heptose:LPS heptosyltransferase